MKIDLKLGAITVADAAALMHAELLTLSADAPMREICNFTDEIGEIARGTMFLVSEDNSLPSWRWRSRPQTRRASRG